MDAGLNRLAVADTNRVDRFVKRRSGSLRREEVRSAGPARLRRTPETSKGSYPYDAGKVRQRIEAAVRRIAPGKVSTYGAVARAAGLPTGARLVARVLRGGFELPWQRVLGSGGEIKLRGDSAMEQRFRLESEGVRFRGKKVDMKTFEFRFATAKIATGRKEMNKKNKQRRR